MPLTYSACGIGFACKKSMLYIFTNTLSIQREIITDFQDATKYQFLVNKKLGVCLQEVNFLSTNS